MGIFKYLAYLAAALSIIGGAFTVLFVYLAFRIPNWRDFLAIWIILGPLNVAAGIFFYKIIKKKFSAASIEKFGKFFTRRRR